MSPFITISIFGPANAATGQPSDSTGLPSTSATHFSEIPLFTTPSPEQWDAITRDLESYQASLTSDEGILSSQISSAVPASVLSTIHGIEAAPGALVTSTSSAIVASTGINLAWLTAVSKGISTQPWETFLEPSLRSAVEAEATSIYRAEQSIVSRDLAASASHSGSPAGLECILGAFVGLVCIANLLL
ncbi:MAG: hypothetical protein M1820_004531 [Bogoriella megaspora]|nr:MAG: hypothetical protein M1820_004531 [Bogoriella megaspora]